MVWVVFQFGSPCFLLSPSITGVPQGSLFQFFQLLFILISFVENFSWILILSRRYHYVCFFFYYFASELMLNAKRLTQWSQMVNCWRLNSVQCWFVAQKFDLPFFVSLMNVVAWYLTSLNTICCCSLCFMTVKCLFMTILCRGNSPMLSSGKLSWQLSLRTM